MEFPEAMAAYRRQMARGAVPQAYRGLMDYLLALRTRFASGHPDYAVSALYQGYLDMSYFALVPAPFKARKLKVAVVFLHEAFRFEAWLAGVNKQVQQEYWQRFKEGGWDRYRLVPTTQGADAILQAVLAEEPDFRDLPALTARLEDGTLQFMREVEGFLARR